MARDESLLLRQVLCVAAVAIPMTATADVAIRPIAGPYSALPGITYYAVMFAMALYGYFASTKPFALISAVVLSIFLAVVESTANASRGYASEACSSVLVPIIGFMLSYAVGVIAGLQKSIKILLVGSVLVDIFAKLAANGLIHDLPLGLCGSRGMHL